MDRKKKYIILSISILISVFIISISIFYIYFYHNNIDRQSKVALDNTELQNIVSNIVSGETTTEDSPTKITENKKFEELDITNLSVSTVNGLTNLLGTITNNTDKETEEKVVDIIFIDKESNELCKMGAYIKKLKLGESTILDSSITFDYSHAYDVIFKRK